MKYKPGWIGKLMVKLDGRVFWEKKLKGSWRALSVPGAQSPGGMVTNTVFEARYHGKVERFASLTLALERLIAA